MLVLRAMIDAAIQCGIRPGYDGRVGLHAAPADTPFHPERFLQLHRQ